MNAAMNAGINRFMNWDRIRADDSEQTRSARSLLYIHDVRSRWFVDGADDCAGDCELDHSAGDPAAKDLKR